MFTLKNLLQKFAQSRNNVMTFKQTLNIFVVSMFVLPTVTNACSSLAILDTEHNLYHGRTLELSSDLPSWLTYYPKNTFFQKKAPNGQNGISYKSKYDILAITTDVYFDGDNKNVLQGLNSAGLSFSANMITSANIDDLKPNQYKDSIPVTAFGEWALSLYANVDQVREAVNKGYFWAPVLKDFGNIKAPLHYAFYDKSGGSIVVEAKNGKFQVYNNPTRVMTNGPDFPWHLQNLNNYTQLTNVDRSSSVLGNIRVEQPDSGIAISNLPSSDTSVGRFIRGVYYTTYADKQSSPHEAVNTLAHIMNRFDRTKNITTDLYGESKTKSPTSMSEYTVWTSLSDVKNGVMFIRGYKDINYSKFSLEQFNQNQQPYSKRINTAEL